MTNRKLRLMAAIPFHIGEAMMFWTENTSMGIYGLYNFTGIIFFTILVIGTVFLFK